MVNKITALLLAVSLLGLSALTFTGCGEENPPSSVTTSEESSAAPDTSADIPAETAPLTAYDYLPDKDYNGKAFDMMTHKNSRYAPGQFITEEETGDLIMDAAYRRNLAVSEKFDVKFTNNSVTSGSYPDLVRAELMAQTTDIDMLFGGLTTVHPLSTEGFFAVNSILPYQQNLEDKPWYTPNLNKGLIYKGKQSMFFSDMTCINFPYGTFMNVSLGERMGITGVEKMALEGKWTIDRLLEYSAKGSVDLDGDGAWTKADQYGFGSYIAVNNTSNGDTALSFQYGMGQFTTAINESGEPILTVNSERTLQILDKLNSLFYMDNRTDFFNTGKTGAMVFAENRMLFFNAILMHAPNYMRDMTDTYIALPMPKLDEDQKDYHTIVSVTGSVHMIPRTVDDPEFASLIFDALSYEGYKQVTPACFEFSMKLKYAANEAASQLYDIIRDSMMMDFGMVYDGGIGMSTIVSGLLARKSMDFASAYASLEPKALAHYADVIKELTKTGN